MALLFLAFLCSAFAVHPPPAVCCEGEVETVSWAVNGSSPGLWCFQMMYSAENYMGCAALRSCERKGKDLGGFGLSSYDFHGWQSILCFIMRIFAMLEVDYQHVYWCSAWNINKDTSWKQTKCINSATFVFSKKKVSSTKEWFIFLRYFIPIPFGVFVESGGDLKLYNSGGDLDYLSWWLWDRLWSRLCASSHAMQGRRGAGKIPIG